MLASLSIQTMFDNQLENFDCYEYLLAVSSDGLYIMNLEKTKIIKTIVFGISNDAFLCSSPDENSFLDAIITIRKVLLQGLDPLTYFEVFLNSNIGY